MTERPPPLTPVDCDLRDFHRMMIDIPRLRASGFDATPDDAAWRAGLNLWMSGFHSIPAASLDDDEGTLCKAAGLGRDLRTFRKVREAAMRGWVLCSDGRWYHETVAEMALEAWLGKLGQRLSSGAGNAKRYGTTFDPEPIRAAIETGAAHLTALNPAAKCLPKFSRHISRQHPDGRDTSSQRDAENVQTGSQVEETVEGEEKRKKKEDSSGPASRRPPDLSAVFIAIPTNRFESSSEEVPITEQFIEEYQKLYPAVDVREQLKKMRGWSLANAPLRKTRKGMTRFINGWLERKQNVGVARETSYGGRNGGQTSSSFGSTLSSVVSERNSRDDERGGGAEIVVAVGGARAAGDSDEDRPLRLAFDAA